MREIKFRAWDAEHKEMMLVDQIDLTGDQGVLVYDENGNEFWFPDAQLMQFTGLKDKNGKEIWEGDILDDGFSRYDLKFEYGIFGCWYRQNDFCALDWILRKHAAKVKVLGNIYSNPELLK